MKDHRRHFWTRTYWPVESPFEDEEDHESRPNRYSAFWSPLLFAVLYQNQLNRYPAEASAMRSWLEALTSDIPRVNHELGTVITTTTTQWDTESFICADHPTTELYPAEATALNRPHQHWTSYTGMCHAGETTSATTTLWDPEAQARYRWWRNNWCLYPAQAAAIGFENQYQDPCGGDATSSTSTTTMPTDTGGCADE